MSEATEIARRRVVYSIEGMDAVNVLRDAPLFATTYAVHGPLLSAPKP